MPLPTPPPGPRILFTSVMGLLSRKQVSIPFNKLWQGQLVAQILNSACKMLPLSLHLFLEEARSSCSGNKRSQVMSQKKEGRLHAHPWPCRTLSCCCCSACISREGKTRAVTQLHPDLWLSLSESSQKIALSPSWLLSVVILWGC